MLASPSSALLNHCSGLTTFLKSLANYHTDEKQNRNPYLIYACYLEYMLRWHILQCSPVYHIEFQSPESLEPAYIFDSKSQKYVAQDVLHSKQQPSLTFLLLQHFSSSVQ